MMDTKIAFHEWLSASAYVRGADHSARVVSKKKHRSKRNSSVSDAEELEAEHKIRVLWKLSNRHYRRWMNDRLLRELAPPLDAQEIGSLFSPPPWGEKSFASPFERVLTYGEGSAQDIAAWEPFRNNVDMDFEAKTLQYGASSREKKLGDDAARSNAALAAWRSISNRSRDVLRRRSSWHLVNLFEEKILEFLKAAETDGLTSLVLDVDDSYHRMVIHGICEFHGLSSRTVSNNMKDTGSNGTFTSVHVKKRAVSKSGDFKENHNVILMQFLMDVKKGSSFVQLGA